RRAALAGVATIEHGGEGTPEIFKLMAEHHVALCPTITAGAGPWPPANPDSPAAQRKRASFKAALDAGVTIINGSDVGTFPHVDRGAGAADGEPDRPGEAWALCGSGGVRGRPDQGSFGAASRDVRDEERHDLPAAVALATINAETAELGELAESKLLSVFRL